MQSETPGHLLDQFLFTCGNCTPAQLMTTGFPEFPHFYMKDGLTVLPPPKTQFLCKRKQELCLSFSAWLISLNVVLLIFLQVMPFHSLWMKKAQLNISTASSLPTHLMVDTKADSISW